MDLGNILGGISQAAQTFADVRNLVDPPRAPTLRDRAAAVMDTDPTTTFYDPAGTVLARQVGTKKGCRRRRRRLLTKSDLGDIAALKGIVGTGKNFENILAAAMYRSR